MTNNHLFRRQDDCFKNRVKQSSIAEILVNIANPPGLETRIHDVPPGKNPLEQFDSNQRNHIRNVLSMKIANVMEQRNILFRILEDNYQNATHQSVHEISDEQEHLDYIADKLVENQARQQFLQNIQSQVNTQAKTNKEPPAVNLIDKIHKYHERHPDLQSFREVNKRRKVNMSMKAFKPGTSHPVFYQHRTKTPSSAANKVGRKILKHEKSDNPVEEAKNELNDWNANFIVTPYAYHNNDTYSPYSHPNQRNSTPDLQAKIRNTLHQHSSIAEIEDETNYYEKDDAGINLISFKARLQDYVLQRDQHIFQDVRTDKETVTIGVIDTWNFADYYWGKHSHLRAKSGTNHKYGAHKDNAALTHEEEQRLRKYQNRVENILSKTPHFNVDD